MVSLTRAVAAAVVVVAGLACGTPSPRSPPVTISPASPSEWQAARATVVDFLTERYGPPSKGWLVAERSAAPFLFEVHSEAGVALLVHRGAVVEARGLDAMGAYLEDTGAIRERRLIAEDVRVLVNAFAVLPPTQSVGDDVDPQAYVYEHAALVPRLDYRDDGAAEFSLFYVLGDDEGDGGAAEPTSRWRVAQWILLLEPGQPPLWTRRRRTYDRVDETLLDEPAKR